MTEKGDARCVVGLTGTIVLNLVDRGDYSEEIMKGWSELLFGFRDVTGSSSERGQGKDCSTRRLGRGTRVLR